MPDDTTKQTPIAIVGVSALMPGSQDADGFWRDIVLGKDLISDVPRSHWLIEDYYDADPTARDKTYGKRGGFLSPVDFDPMEFGIPPANLSATDTAQLLSLLAAKRLLDDATQGDPAKIDRSRTSVILGLTGALELVAPLASRLQRPIWARAIRESGIPDPENEAICDRIAAAFVPWQEASFPGLLPNVVAGRIANRFDLHGANLVTDAACASSLSAIGVAIGELSLGRADLVIAGGVDANNDVFVHMCFSKTPALSPTGDCRPFSDAADGTLLGEGIAMFALKRLADAERDGDGIYAVIRGVGSSSDGRHKSIYAPRPEGQALAIRRAYEAAGFGPRTVELVEAHGTGTKAGDVAELEGLKAVFGDSSETPWCAIGSIKSQVGHTKGAAGAAGLFKIVMAVHQKVLPPTIKVTRLNPALGIESSPFYVNVRARPWIGSGSHPRRAAVSSFGFGGTNFHAAVEEYVPSSAARQARQYRASPTELVLVSAPSPRELAARLQSMLATPTALAPLADECQRSFRPADETRLAIVAVDATDLAARLSTAVAALADRQTTLSAPGIQLRCGPSIAGDVAFVFPGQGSQYLGMGCDLAIETPVARRVWEEAPRFDGIGLHDVAFPPDPLNDAARRSQEARLTLTEWAQPAIGAVSLAVLDVLRAARLHPACVAGHSFGELTALHAAGALRREDFLRLARHRGVVMRNAASRAPGAMLAVHLPGAKVHAILADRGIDAVVANYNSPNDVVVSGGVEAIDALERALAGATARRLPVSAAFHSPAVAPAVPDLAAFLQSIELQPPELDVYANADAQPYLREAAGLRTKLADQLARPVRFADSIGAMYDRGIRVFVEVGPGSVLTDLIGRILDGRPHLAVAMDRRQQHGMTTLQLAFGQLAVAGVALQFDGLRAESPRVEGRTRRSSGTPVRISGTNVGKPYPPPDGDIEARVRPQGSAAGAMNPALTADRRPGPPARAQAPAPSSVGPSPASPLPPQPPDSSAPAGGTARVPPAWIAAFQDAQRHAAETHAAFQRALADSHAAFLRAAEASMQGLIALATGANVPAPRVPLPELPRFSPPEMPPLPTVASPGAPPADARAPAVTVHAPHAVADSAPSIVAPTTAPAAVAASSPRLDLGAVLMAVVAEKTGYQESLLGMDMDLEADLGIDSIKRVEILVALQDRVPGLLEVTLNEIASLRTLGAVVAYLRSQTEVEDRPEPASAVSAGAASDERSGPAAGGADVTRYAVRAIPEPGVGMTLASLTAGGRLVVTDDGSGVAGALAAELARRRVRAEVVSQVPADADGVIFLGGLRDVATADDAIALNREAFRAARAVASRFADGPGVFVTAQDTGGDFGLSGSQPLSCWLGGIAALVRTLRHEWPAASLKAIDCARSGRSAESIARAIADELFHGGSTLEVALAADGTRRARHLVASPLNGGSALPRRDAVIVATGGGRGVTAAALCELARAQPCRFALLGRTTLVDEPRSCAGGRSEASLRRVLAEEAQRRGEPASPAEIGRRAAGLLASREIRATLAALEAAGSQARYFAVDTRERDALDGALAQVRAEWGPVIGLVHGAGVIADTRLEHKTDAQFDRVFDTKVLGLSHLLAATNDDPLELICLFSSVAAHVGNAGQSDYAMANEVLNLVAAAERARRNGTCVVRSIGWGPWRGGMVSDGMAERFEARGIGLLPLASGARFFVSEVAAPAAEEAVVMVAAPSRNGDGVRHVAFDVPVHPASHPQLRDHALETTPLVPVALAIEWLLRAVRDCHPGRAVSAIRDVRVRRGARLARFDEGERLVVQCEVASAETRCALLLPRQSDLPCYTAVSDLSEGEPYLRLEAADGVEAPVRYDGVELFQGPMFQAMRSLGPATQHGMTATLDGLGERGWPAEPWITDPAACDAAIQLAGLWAGRMLGDHTLPMGVGVVRVHRSGPAAAPISARAIRRSVGAGSAVCDVILRDAGGAVVIELLGVESVRRPAAAARP